MNSRAPHGPTPELPNDPPTGSVEAVIATPEIWLPLARHATTAYPNEACALIVGRLERPRLILAENLADTWHAIDPTTFPRTSRNAYILDPRLIVAAERDGESLVAIVHSHCDVGAYFSAEDARLAVDTSGSHPLFPGVRYVVLDVQTVGVRAWKTFQWSTETRDFVESYSSTVRGDECGVAPCGARAVEDSLAGANAPPFLGSR